MKHQTGTLVTCYLKDCQGTPPVVECLGLHTSTTAEFAPRSESCDPTNRTSQPKDSRSQKCCVMPTSCIRKGICFITCFRCHLLKIQLSFQTHVSALAHMTKFHSETGLNSFLFLNKIQCIFLHRCIYSLSNSLYFKCFIL